MVVLESQFHAKHQIVEMELEIKVSRMVQTMRILLLFSGVRLYNLPSFN